MSRAFEAECKLVGCVTCTVVVGGPYVGELPGGRFEKGNVM